MSSPLSKPSKLLNRNEHNLTFESTKNLIHSPILGKRKFGMRKRKTYKSDIFIRDSINDSHSVNSYESDKQLNNENDWGAVINEDLLLKKEKLNSSSSFNVSCSPDVELKKKV